MKGAAAAQKKAAAAVAAAAAAAAVPPVEAQDGAPAPVPQQQQQQQQTWVPTAAAPMPGAGWGTNRQLQLAGPGDVTPQWQRGVQDTLLILKATDSLPRPFNGASPMPPWATATGLGLVAPPHLPNGGSPFWTAARLPASTMGMLQLQGQQLQGQQNPRLLAQAAAAAQASQQQHAAAAAAYRQQHHQPHPTSASKRPLAAPPSPFAPMQHAAKRARLSMARSVPASPVTPDEGIVGGDRRSPGARALADAARSAAMSPRLPEGAVEASSPGLLLRAGDARLGGALSAPAFDEDDVSDAWRDARALIVRVGRDGSTGSPVAAASTALDELLASRAPPAAGAASPRPGGASFARRFAEAARAAIDAKGANGALTLGWATKAAGGAIKRGDATIPVRAGDAATRAAPAVVALEQEFLAPLLEAMWSLQTAASAAVPAGDAERFVTDRALGAGLRYPTARVGWSKVSVHVSVVRRDADNAAPAADGWDAGAGACPGHVDAFGVSPILVLNVGDSYVPGGRLCLLEAAGADSGARPIVVPTDASRAMCVFADFNRRHGQLPFERPARSAASELLRVTVEPYCALSAVRWSRCVAQRVGSPEVARWVPCAACGTWGALAPTEAAPPAGAPWTCPRCRAS